MHENKARLKIGGINTFPQYRNIYLILKDVLQIVFRMYLFLSVKK